MLPTNPLNIYALPINVFNLLIIYLKCIFAVGHIIKKMLIKSKMLLIKDEIIGSLPACYGERAIKSVISINILSMNWKSVNYEKNIQPFVFTDYTVTMRL